MQTSPSSHPDVQLNLGHFNRFCRRDYIEINAPDSIKMFLATTSSAELDARAIDNEYLFQYRFGFFANQTIREQIVAIKKQHALTDEEIRSLRHAGQLTIKRDEAKLTPSPIMAAMGWVYALIFSFVCAVCFLAIQTTAEPSWKQWLGTAMVGACWLGSIWFVSKVHLSPWRLLKQVGVVGHAQTAARHTG